MVEIRQGVRTEPHTRYLHLLGRCTYMNKHHPVFGDDDPPNYCLSVAGNMPVKIAPANLLLY